jgi:signal transduction histidine kinase
MFEICLRNSESLKVLIEDLLDLNQVERTPEAHRRVDIDDVLLDVVHDLGHGAASRGVHVDVVARSEAIVLGDPGQLRRVVLNLVSNAIKFSYAGGDVRVGAEAGPGSVEIFVSDTGMGIPEGEISRIGEQFYRGSNAVVSEIGGTGLGLRIVYSIVKQHGGTFTVTSPKGQGTTCRVRFTQSDQAPIEALVGPAGSAAAG